MRGDRKEEGTAAAILSFPTPLLSAPPATYTPTLLGSLPLLLSSLPSLSPSSPPPPCFHPSLALLLRLYALPCPAPSLSQEPF